MQGQSSIQMFEKMCQLHLTIWSSNIELMTTHRVAREVTFASHLLEIILFITMRSVQATASGIREGTLLYAHAFKSQCFKKIQKYGG